MDHDAYSEPAPIPRGGVEFPLQLKPPEGFRAEEPSTWPRVTGRVEFVRGRLLYMPPCGDDQQDVALSVAGILDEWCRKTPGFVAGANEAGMILGGEVRGADAAVWRKDAVGPRTGGYRRSPPLLAVEVAGRDEGEEQLRLKARWYLDKGVQVVWVVLPATREVIVLQGAGEARHSAPASVPTDAHLPGLAPEVARFFAQLS